MWERVRHRGHVVRNDEESAVKLTLERHRLGRHDAKQSHIRKRNNGNKADLVKVWTVRNTICGTDMF